MTRQQVHLKLDNIGLFLREFQPQAQARQYRPVSKQGNTGHFLSGFLSDFQPQAVQAGQNRPVSE